MCLVSRDSSEALTIWKVGLIGKRFSFMHKNWNVFFILNWKNMLLLSFCKFGKNIHVYRNCLLKQFLNRGML